MQTLILSLHIGSATLLTIATVAVLVSAYRQSATKLHGIMLGFFGSTLLSGVGLLVLGIGSFGRICLSMTAVSVAVLIVSHYYQVRTAQLSA